MAIPAINVLGNPNVTEGNFQIAIEDLRKSVIGSGKAYDSSNTYSQYDTCVSGGIVYYSKINSNTGNTPAVNANWGLIGDLFNLLITNGTAFGYGTGSGGTVTQGSSLGKGTAVTLNKPTGVIIMNNAALAAGASVYFTFTCSALNVNAQDVLLISPRWGSVSPTNYDIKVSAMIGSSSTIIEVKNISGSTLSESVEINFAVFKVSYV